MPCLPPRMACSPAVRQCQCCNMLLDCLINPLARLAACTSGVRVLGFTSKGEITRHSVELEMDITPYQAEAVRLLWI